MLAVVWASPSFEGRACLYIDAARRRVLAHGWLYGNQQRVTSKGEVKNL
jgi:hypothetical protein